MADIHDMRLHTKVLELQGRLTKAGIKVQRCAGYLLVADRFELYPDTGWWRERSVSRAAGAQGYSISKLIEAAVEA